MRRYSGGAAVCSRWTVVDSGAVVVDWAFVWREWCRLVVVAVCELQKSARSSRGIGRGLECWLIFCLRQGLVPSALKKRPLPNHATETSGDVLGPFC